MKKHLVDTCLKIARDNFNKHPQVTIFDSHSHFVHFTFIIVANKIVGYGMNKSPPMSFPKLASYPPGSMVHSEVDAFFKYRGALARKPFDILNIRLNWQLQIKNSQPCIHCMNFLRSAGCNDIWFSTDSGFARYV
jgi:hypothetical protein